MLGFLGLIRTVSWYTWDVLRFYWTPSDAPQMALLFGLVSFLVQLNPRKMEC